MDNNTFYYHGLPIENDGDELFPFYIPTLAGRGKTCRFRTLPAAKAAITRLTTMAFQRPMFHPNTSNHEQH